MTQSTSLFSALPLPIALRWALGLGQPNPEHTIADLRVHIGSLCAEAKKLQDLSIQRGIHDPVLADLCSRIKTLYTQISKPGPELSIACAFPARPYFDPLFAPDSTLFGPALRISALLQALERAHALCAIGPRIIAQLCAIGSVVLEELWNTDPAMADLTANQIAAWLNNPNDQPVFSRLTSLALDRLSLKVLPKEIGNLTTLKWLDLVDNRLELLPAEIGKLTSLQALHLEGNRLELLPAEIGKLTSLQALHLEGNFRLGLRSNCLRKLPPEIGTLTGLRTLRLSGNFLKALPPEIGGLTSLCELYVERNSLQALPREIGTLTGLITLRLSGNFLQALPPEIGGLTSLCELYVERNSLQALPREIGRLTGLETLLLANNELQALPPEIDKLTSLTRLGLAHNTLESLQPQVPDFADVTGNLVAGFEVVFQFDLVDRGPGIRGAVGDTVDWDNTEDLVPDLSRSTRGYHINSTFWRRKMSAAQVRAGKRYEFKIVLPGFDGSTVWETGPNRVSVGPPMEPIVPRFEGI